MRDTLVPAGGKKGNLEIEFEFEPLFMYLHSLYTFVKQKICSVLHCLIFLIIYFFVFFSLQTREVSEKIAWRFACFRKMDNYKFDR
jgi:hypothetical protein